ncbi:hypothetical protein RISK_001729 [Rhodopirellula islandica]|uniref:Uncharacterized protein n=1 Tax=Rhodopirellula islandica TaxID=595434 RepID=A0A0J1BJB2_RHOIS|nr:hypothetical protein RISK_001729 [Rhodopirellula islandica]
MQKQIEFIAMAYLVAARSKSARTIRGTFVKGYRSTIP